VPNVAALDGLRVLDVSNLLAAPVVSAILADFGADVVKVEPPAGDPLRTMGARRDGRSLMWAFANRNKRAITLDLGSAGGQQLFRRLVPHFDVLVENLTTELRARWHCTYDELHALHPSLVAVSVTCYGTDGPYASRPGAGTLAEAFAGLTALTGQADGPPTLASVPIGDMLTGIVGALGTVVAAFHQRATGEGQHVDVSMYEPVLQLLASTVAGWDTTALPPRRSGSRVPGGVPRNVYRTSDGEWIAVSGTTDAQVARLLPLLGRDDDASRARFGASAARLAVADELDALVAAWVASRPRDDVLAALHGARVPAAPVNDLRALHDDPHVVARDDFVTLDGLLTLVAPAPRLSRTPGVLRATGPRRGEHNDTVYGELLGLSHDELARLRDTGVV
jgi:crotonobetainyl-CoA:carnitine CoA-transferase CaiB-like acyl-CoA transferase